MPDRTQTAPATGATAASTSASTFVGRAREMRDLESSLEGVRAGSGRLYLIAGEPGIGKTRLADELARYGAERGVQSVWGRCWEGGGAPPYWPWRQIIRSCLRSAGAPKLLSEMGSCAHDLTNIAPEVREHISAGAEVAPLPSDPEQARFRLFDSAATFLRAMSSYHPMLIVLEDLHAADLPSLLLLRFVARNLNDAGILLLGTYRDAELRQARAHADLLGQLASDSQRITLHGLGEAEVRELLQREHGKELDERTITAVFAATDGNPLFVREISHSSIGRAAPGSDPGLRSKLQIPNGVRAAIHRHLAPLTETARQMLSTASVIGRDFEFAVLQPLSGMAAAELADAIAQAVSADLVNEVPDRLGLYRFSHALVRDSLYEEVPAAAAAKLHVSISEILEDTHKADLDIHLSEIAHHYLQGVASGADAARAIGYAQRAAQHATASLAYEEAERIYQLAIGACGHQRPPDEGLRCELLLGLAEAQNRAGTMSTARETFRSAAELASGLGSHENLGRAALGIAATSPDAHTIDTESLTWMGRALQALGAADSALKARLLAQLAVKSYLSHERTYRSELIEQAVATARRLGDRECMLFVLNAKRRALWEPENAEERLAIATEALNLAEACGDRETALKALEYQIGDLTEIGDMEAAKAATATFVREANALRQPFYLWQAGYLAASQALLEGRYEEAERLSNEALALGQGLGSTDPMYTFSAQLAVLYRDKCRLGEMEAMFSAHAERNPGTPVFRCTAAHIKSELGREAEVRREFDYLTGAGFESLPRRGVDWPVVLMLLSEICCYLRDKRKAPLLYELLLPFANRNLTSFHIVSFGSTATSLGKLATVMQRYDDAETNFEYAVAFNDRIRARQWHADSQYEYARMLLERSRNGDREHAAQLLESAAATAETIGSVRLSGRIKALRQETGLDGQVDTPTQRPAEKEAPPPRTPSSSETPAVREGFEFFREGDYWTIASPQRTMRLKHVKGLSYIETLMRNPGREIHAIALASGGASIKPEAVVTDEASAREDREAAGDSAGFGDAGEMLDATAKSAYRRRLAELNEDLANAKEIGDVVHASELEDEIDAIARELRRAVGLMGRDRMAASAAERARLNVTRAIKTVIDRIAEHDGELGQKLSHTIRTGTFCCYMPDSAASHA